MTEIIDAHQHIWTLARADYPWMDPSDAVIHRDYSIDDAVARLDAAGIAGTVLVQSADNVEDSLTMFDAARASDRVRGVVAWAPLDDARTAEALLERWHEEPAFCGIRTLIHTRDDASWLSSRAAAPGLRLLAERGIPMDVVAVDPAHLRAAIAVGERHPGLPLVIDHLGHPPVKGSDAGEWSVLMGEVAANPAVCAKVSGLYPVAGAMDDWSEADLSPFVDRGLELFGADRLMYGGDWPISELGGGYARVWAALSALIGRLDGSEREQILAGTAARFYRLGRGTAATGHGADGVDAHSAGAPAEGKTS